MNQAQQDQAHPSRPAWRQVMDLGEQLMCLSASKEPVPDSKLITTQHNLIVETAERLFKAQTRLWLNAPALIRVSGEASPGEEENPLSPLMARAIETQSLCGAREPGSSQIWQLPLSGRIKALHVLAAPLVAYEPEGQRDFTLGVIQVAHLQNQVFTANEIDLFEGLASQVSAALKAWQQARREKWRLEQLALVRQVSLQVAGVRDLDELARQVTSLILDTFDYYYVAIFTLQPGQPALHFRASAGPRRAEDCKHEPYSPALVVHIGEGIIGTVAQSGQEILAADVRDDDRYLHLDALPETLSEIALPLKIEERILGVLDVQSDQANDFDETDVLVLRALADNIAFAIEGAHLYGEVNQRAEQLNTIYEVSNALSSILDQERLLKTVVELIHKRLGYPYVHLFSVHTGRRKLFYEAGSGEYLPPQDFSLEMDDPDGLAPWVARNAETVLANDVRAEPRYHACGLPPAETRSELVVPLVFGEQALGVLDIRSNHINAFDEDDRFLLETLADNIAVTLRNAALYRSEVWRRQAADSLREVAGLLSTEVDLGQVLDAILVELERNLPLDLAAIWLLDEEFPAEDDTNPPSLYLAATRGRAMIDLGLEAGLRPVDILTLHPSERLESDPEAACAWLSRALVKGQPVIRTPDSPFEPLGAALDYPVDYSAIAAPLRVGEQPVGVLALAHQTAGRYGSEARAMTAAFASYAAVAIENTRLYEAAHEQAWVSTVLLQVAEATQSQTDLHELLETVMRITPTLSGVKACLLYMRDEDGFFIPAAASGLAPEGLEAFEGQQLAPEEIPALEQLLEARHPLVLRDQGDDRTLTGLFYAGQEASARSFQADLMVLVPLLAQNEVLGAFLVDYRVDLFAGNGYQSLEEFFDERLAIIQGIAHQTAMAVDNIRLLRSQKEEAYISVALLQVAQAVVSSNELDEALGSIVRITPILVGVKRAAIYLWGGQEAQFTLFQAYGLPRQMQDNRYSPEDFPFLYAVYLHNSLLACPSAACAGESEDGQPGWHTAPTPDLEQVERYLEEDDCLLLAFPLSIKGQFLGVLLVEEPEPGNNNDWADSAIGLGSSNRRLRDRRMEIVTGISQQAALAIQNDQLQRQMLERERMEREMQLARDIQRTFLPARVPDLPGWDLQVLWRTARQVGGDFYDFFPLPDGRFGLVIADVADKGMPAALFMTLVRTLVRATVQDIADPSAVLQRVNEVIVPDAHQGMFVTLAYGVLCLESGKFHYANAGHNPPLVLRRDNGAIERLEKSGMALGVLEGSRFEDRMTSLETGDALVMYTDGVTEAFSAQEDFYGEARLCQTLDSAMPGAETAGDLLEAIDHSVSDFIGDAPLSDDLTLLVIKRLSPPA